ncbi:uncharacterized protein LOC134623877 [Pelmatolapia mariae]|uniref:uncharacterized protein LOC134623877 n=1 Tax=Pelmatolapia mariae TaxID=158779 RepID=UPI002FE6B381
MRFDTNQKIITAESGQDVTLPCRAPNSNIIIVLEWSRADLGEKYVLLFQDERFYPDQQHPSFRNRVDLQDRQMKDGDVSLILKKVTINDTGTYECRVFMRERHHRKRGHLKTDPISIIDLSVVPPEQKNITAESGQDVTLPCRAPSNNIILGVEWNRADLEDEYVLFYRDEQFDPVNQHPFFKNRVDLQDKQMKDGDVSLILKNVTIIDNGTYQCRVFMRGTNVRKRANQDGDPISIIYLSVVPPGHTGGDTEDGGKEDGGKEAGSVGLIIGLSVSAVLLVAAVSLLIYRKHKQQQTQDSY